MTPTPSTPASPAPQGIRPAEQRDLPWALGLNNAAEPGVNGLSEAELTTLADWAAEFLVVEDSGRPAGFVLALDGPGLPYESLNYRWFSRRFASFLYVDRIVVDARLRAGGLGRRLYGALAEAATGRWPRVCAEVNVRPPNPASLRFHERFGFRPLDQQDTEGGAKRVQLLELPLDPGSP